MQRPFPERNRDAHGAGQRFPDHSKTPNHPITQLPNYPITQLPNYPITQLPNYPTTQLPNYPTTQLPNYPTTQLPNYPSGKQQHSLSNATAGQGRAGQGRAGQGRAGPTISRTSAAACIVCRDRIYIPPLQHLIMPGRFAEDHP
ncbi:hypothetical protein [Xylella fastidiosa]|uniref:hypothetical protein n=1 Tax=Xylella fastidiosa TaxID=2371 RepID=UPI001FC82E55|nr:hypothetical protein [Xylella fastidiosa]